jgi:trk system potassium uptake protein TrkA
MNGSVEVLEFLVKEDIENLTDIPLRDLRTVDGLLIACIMRGDTVTIPSGNDAIRKGDTVVVVTTSGRQMDSIGDIIR